METFFTHSPADPQSVGQGLWLIIALPLLGAIICGLFGRALGRGNTNFIATSAVFGSFLLAALSFWALNDYRAVLHSAFSDVYTPHALGQQYGTWFSTNAFRATFGLRLDHLSGAMVLVITGVGALIHLYSTAYMEHDPGYWRYFAYLNLFVAMMLILVLADNLALLFVGWEGVGLCSYLLIGFWYEDPAKAWAGRKAFVVNRIGDFGFLIGALLLVLLVGAFDQQWQAGGSPRGHAPWHAAVSQEGPLHFQALEGMARVLGSPAAQLPSSVQLDSPIAHGPLAGMTFGAGLTLVLLLFMLGAAGKSAQIPLYVWLPDAMAGPTPVSALIHAATMVTAGVYLVARLNFLFALSPAVMTVIAMTGAITAMFAASIGFVQNDIKKVLAYSTVSQLGFMFIGVGVGAFWAGAYHLLTHAFFKACLFLGSGSVILGCHHEQDMRKMGGLKRFMPLTEKTYLYACIAISGFPIANAFFSKDEILWRAFDSGHNLLDPSLGKLIWFIGWLTACGTSFYMWRSYYMTFTGEYRGAAGHRPSHGALATHSVGAAHAGTFNHDLLMSATVFDDDPHPDSGGVDAHAKGTAKHPDHPDHKAEGGHGHGGVPHESPGTMTYVLVTLAAGCAATIVLGFWAPLGNLLGIDALKVPLLEHWLEPTMAPTLELVEKRSAQSGHAWEWALIFASVGVAFLGWIIARSFYKDARSHAPAKLAAMFPRLHRVVYNKYY